MITTRLSGEKMEKAKLRRDRLLDFFKAHGVKFPQNNLSKPYWNSLSPGCWTCVNGTWSCIFINRLCTRNCFFCPREEKKERIPESEGLTFRNPDSYIDHLKKFDYRGVGFSGGEPFIVFDKLVEYIVRIREAFGKRHYLWIYTNGDLVTPERLRLLNKSGLNELRFDLAARDYDLGPLRLAVNFIDTVTVEIPAIPEDLKIVRPLIKELEALGVKFINIHQLHSSRSNEKEFKKRGYTLLASDFFRGQSPVLESELAALEMMKYAVQIKSKMGINYCSLCYKGRFQVMAYRKRYAPLFKDINESITETGFIRSVVLPARGIPKTVSSSELWKAPEMKDEHSPIEINYYSIKKNGKALVRSMEFRNETSKTLYNKLFLERKNTGKVLQEISKRYRLSKDDLPSVSEDIHSFRREFEDLEYNPRHLPDYRQIQRKG